MIESAGRYYLRLTHVETRAGVRLAGRTAAAGPREAPATVLPAVSVRSEKGGSSLLVTHGEVTAIFPVRTRMAG